MIIKPHPQNLGRLLFPAFTKMALPLDTGVTHFQVCFQDGTPFGFLILGQ